MVEWSITGACRAPTRSGYGGSNPSTSTMKESAKIIPFPVEAAKERAKVLSFAKKEGTVVDFSERLKKKKRGRWLRLVK
jgi:hypothetical protein